eukprot:363413-Chlamydomonas_euryale.AAC.4
MCSNRSVQAGAVVSVRRDAAPPTAFRARSATAPAVWLTRQCMQWPRAEQATRRAGGDAPIPARTGVGPAPPTT